MVDRNQKCLDWLSVRQSGWGWRDGSMVKTLAESPSLVPSTHAMLGLLTSSGSCTQAHAATHLHTHAYTLRRSVLEWPSCLECSPDGLGNTVL